MHIRLLMAGCLIALMAVAGWSKEKLDPAALMAKSDAQYYYPPAHGVQDLAVDLAIPELAANSISKAAKLSYYYAGDGKQRFTAANIPDQYAKFRTELLALVAPLADYLMPRPSTATFVGLDQSVKRVYRQLSGLPDTQFYQLVGVSKDEKADVREYRVLLDERGLAHQVENVMKDGSLVMARVENRQVDDHWFVGKVTTRLLTRGGAQWKIDTIEYDKVDGYILPSRITVQYRDEFNERIKGVDDMTVLFQNYRINQGAAAAVFAASAGADTPKAAEPAETTEPAPSAEPGQ